MHKSKIQDFCFTLNDYIFDVLVLSKKSNNIELTLTNALSEPSIRVPDFVSALKSSKTVSLEDYTYTSLKN